MVAFVTKVTKGSLFAVVNFVTVLVNVNIDFLVSMVIFPTMVTNIHWLLCLREGAGRVSL